MTKTLPYGYHLEGEGNLTPLHYKTVTATKIDFIEEDIKNVYKDDEGNYYRVCMNEFYRRQEFMKIPFTEK